MKSFMKKDEVWIWIGNKKRDIDKKTEGKFLIFAKIDIMKKIVINLTPFINSGKIQLIKFSHRESDKDPLKDKTPIMCVYSDDKNKEGVWKILEKIGIKQKIWKYDEQSREDWSKNGRLTKKAERIEGIGK